MLDVAKRFIGRLHEVSGAKDHPFIAWCLSLCGFGFDAHDETPWCSAFVNGMAFICGLERSGSAAARSWLVVGTVIDLEDAMPGNDIVILKRGQGLQPGPDVIKAPGHVALFAGIRDGKVAVVGGNQSNGVSLAVYPIEDVLGVRRLADQTLFDLPHIELVGNST